MSLNTRALGVRMNKRVAFEKAWGRLVSCALPRTKNSKFSTAYRVQDVTAGTVSTTQNEIQKIVHSHSHKISPYVYKGLNSHHPILQIRGRLKGAPLLFSKFCEEFDVNTLFYISTQHYSDGAQTHDPLL